MRCIRYFFLGALVMLLMTKSIFAQNSQQANKDSQPLNSEQANFAQHPALSDEPARASAQHPALSDEPVRASAQGVLPPEAGNTRNTEFSDKISLDLKGVDINELFKVLSTKSGITITTSPEIKGRVTVFIDNLSFADALDVIITMQDLAYERKGNVVKVMTAVEYEKLYGKKYSEHKETRTFKLAYAKPANVLNVINLLKTDLGKIISDESTGTIIIIDTPQSVSAIAETIKGLDQPLETVVFDVNYARFADIKSFLNDLITPGVGQIILDERSSKVMVYDLPQRLARIKKLMSEFDE